MAGFKSNIHKAHAVSARVLLPHNRKGRVLKGPVTHKSGGGFEWYGVDEDLGFKQIEADSSQSKLSIHTIEFNLDWEVPIFIPQPFKGSRGIVFTS